jgi:ribonuclease HI
MKKLIVTDPVRICGSDLTSGTLDEKRECMGYDRSAIEGAVGAAAVLMQDGEVKDKLRFYLGKDSEHMVYEGEIVGMILAVELLRRAGGGERASVALGVDNQAAIRGTKLFNSQPGHYLMDIFHDDLRTLLPSDNRRKLVVRWTPEHINIPGNEKADESAKRVAKGDITEADQLPTSLHMSQSTPTPLPISKFCSALPILGTKIDLTITIAVIFIAVIFIVVLPIILYHVLLQISIPEFTALIF